MRCASPFEAGARATGCVPRTNPVRRGSIRGTRRRWPSREEAFVRGDAFDGSALTGTTRKIVQPLIDAFDVEMTEFLWINHPDYNFLGVINGKSDDDIQSACNILYSSGAWISFSWFRAFESNQMKEIFVDASKKMANYISSIQVAEKK